MATYYVRASMGNDGNTGLSPAQAWLTVDHAANQVTAGDRVNIGAGIYREAVAMDTPGTSGSEIVFYGDVEGIYTGDPGFVIITAHDTPTGVAVRAQCLFTNEQEFIEWYNVIFSGGTTCAVGDAGAPAAPLAYEGCLFDHCVFFGGPVVVSESVWINVGAGVTPTADGMQFIGCIFFTRIYLQSIGNGVAHVNLKWNFTNCVFWGRGYMANSEGALVYGTGSSFTIGGVDFENCLFIGGTEAVEIEGLRNTTNQVRVLNSVSIGSAYIMKASGGLANAGYEDYNRGWGTRALVSGAIQSGGNSDITISFPHMGGFSDIAWRKELRWSPWYFFEPIAPSPAIDAGYDGYAPADDLYTNPRPMLRSLNDDIGPVEARARPEDETVTVYDGSHAIRFTGAGFHDFLIPVDAEQITVTIWARYDSNYAGNSPLLELFNVPGVADQSDAMAAAADTWEQLSITVTPTSTGYVRARIRSRDSSANGECYFDLLEVETP